MRVRVRVRVYSMAGDTIWRGYTSWAFRELAHGRDVRWALRTLWRMLGMGVHVGRMSYEARIGPFSIVHWRGGEDRWRIGPRPPVRVPGGHYKENQMLYCPTCLFVARPFAFKVLYPLTPEQRAEAVLAGATLPDPPLVTEPVVLCPSCKQISQFTPLPGRRQHGDSLLARL